MAVLRVREQNIWGRGAPARKDRHSDPADEEAGPWRAVATTRVALAMMRSTDMARRRRNEAGRGRALHATRPRQATPEANGAVRSLERYHFRPLRAAADNEVLRTRRDFAAPRAFDLSSRSSIAPDNLVNQGRLLARVWSSMVVEDARAARGRFGPAQGHWLPIPSPRSRDEGYQFTLPSRRTTSKRITLRDQSTTCRIS